MAMAMARSGWKAGGALRVEMDEEEEDAGIPPPQTPLDPMEYLSRSWSVSASEISKILVAGAGAKRTSFAAAANRPLPVPEMAIPEIDESAFMAIVPSSHRHHTDERRSSISIGGGHHESISKWFYHRDASRRGKQSGKKEKLRAERAHVHAMVSVVRVAAAVAAVAAASATTTASSDSDDAASRMAAAMAPAAELLATHCVEVARRAGASHELVACAVRSAVGASSPGDLTTLTAAAATALRGAAAMKQRVQREARSSASVLPYEKGHSWSPDVWCKEGELLKRTRKGDLHRTKVSIYISKTSQVMLKLKSKHIGGALSKNNKSVVYGVYSELPTWVIEPGKALMDERRCFGLSTAQGLVEFECVDGASKKSWVDDVQNLLRQAAATVAGDKLESSVVN